MSSDGATNETSEALTMAEEHYVKAKTCVWWDIENCPVPRSCDPYSIAQNIRKALAEWNYKGVVTISAYGDTRLINSSVQQALSSTGVGLNHVPAGIKDASDKKILVDMLIWGYDNPPPATHLLISGDRDFSNALHQLRMKGYNILLAQPEKVSQALVSAAKTVWLWTSLVVGGRPLEKIPELHNTLISRKPNIQTQSNSILCLPQQDYFDQKKIDFGDSDKHHNKGKQTSKSQNQPITNTLSSEGNLFGELSSSGLTLIDYLEKNKDKFTDVLLPSTISNLLASMPGGFDVLLNALKLEQHQMKAKDEQLNGRYHGEGSKPPKSRVEKVKAFRDKWKKDKERRQHKIKVLKIKKNKASACASTLSAKEKGQHKIKAQKYNKNKASANAFALPTKKRGLHKIKAQKNKASTKASTLSAAVDDQQIPNTTEFKCFECGKVGHIRKQCPDTQGSVPVHAHDVLPKDEIVEGKHHNNTSKTEALANAPVLTASSTSQGVVHTFEDCEKVGDFQNRCSEKQGSTPGQAYDILSSNDNMEEDQNSKPKSEALANAPALHIPPTSRRIPSTFDGKCFGCGKVGHFHKRCPGNRERASIQASNVLSRDENMEEDQNSTPKGEALANAPALHIPLTSRRIPNTFDGKCFGCGKVGHFHKRCPGNRELASIQASNVLSRDENVEENQNNTPKREALTNAPALHTQPTSRRIPNTFDGRCFGCGEVGHFRNRCPGNREQASIQAYNALSRDENVEENHNTSKSEGLTNAPGALHTPLLFRRIPNAFDGRCFGCEEVGHFHNRCPGNREQASIQAYNVLSRDHNMEFGTYNDTANAPVLHAPLANHGYPYNFEGQMLQRWNNGEFSESMWRDPRTDCYPNFYQSFY